MKSLLSLERVLSTSNISLLRHIHENLEVQIRSLENLGIDSTMYGTLINSYHNAKNFREVKFNYY